MVIKEKELEDLDREATETIRFQLLLNGLSPAEDATVYDCYCVGECSGGCAGGCYSGCVGSCTGECYGSCSGSCDGGCVGSESSYW